MIKALLHVRFRALFARSFRNGLAKKQGTGMKVLLAFLFVYLAVVFCGMFAALFNELTVYCTYGLTWLYFAMAGLLALMLSVIGGVFTTQSQLYDARDNELLLSMPIRPRIILLSRMVPLLVLNLLFCAVVLGPAGVVYGIKIGFTPAGLVGYLLCSLAVPFAAQAIACLLGWLLHLLLSRINKSLASVLYLVVFLGVYFTVYSQINQILASMVTSGDSIAAALRAWVWPIYAMGLASMGNFLYLLAFLAITGGVFGLIYWLLSVSFLRSTLSQRSIRRKSLRLDSLRAGSAGGALEYKELRHFLNSPVYLTNMGLGLVFLVALTIAGVIFRGKVLELFSLLPGIQVMMPLLIVAMLGFMVSMTCITAPSISLEGKTLWIIQSLPLTSEQILKAKLRFHCKLVLPLTALAGLVLSVALGCGPVGIVLSCVVPVLLGFLCGLLGLLFNLLMPRFDWISEAYPCKQSMPVMLTMLVMWGVILLLGLLYGVLLSQFLLPEPYLLICCGTLLLLCFVLYRHLLAWGVKRFQAL